MEPRNVTSIYKFLPKFFLVVTLILVILYADKTKTPRFNPSR